MDCERFDKVTLDLLYAELDELSAAAARRHLHHCTRCQGIWNKLRATKDITVVPLVEPPADLFESILEAEHRAESALPLPQRFSRLISIVAGYAMRPQLAMAALLLLMIGSSLLFVRQDPAGRDQVSVTELGAPRALPLDATRRAAPVVVEGDAAPAGPAVPAAAAAAEPPDAQTLPTAPPASYADAMTAYSEGRYAEAERLFGEVAAQGGEKAASAAVHEGHAARNGSGCQRAARLYDSVAERYAGTPLGEEASWHAASCYQALGELSRARAHYLALKDSPAFGQRATAALSGVEESLANSGLKAQAEVATAAAAPPADAGLASASAASAGAKTAAAPAPAPAAPSAPAGAAPAKAAPVRTGSTPTKAGSN
jgi:hypothetical protein